MHRPEARLSKSAARAMARLSYDDRFDSAPADGNDLLETIASALPKEGPGLTVAEIRERVGIGIHRLRELLQECLNHGLIDRAGSGKRSDPFRYGRRTQMLL